MATVEKRRKKKTTRKKILIWPPGRKGMGAESIRRFTSSREDIMN